MRTILVIDDDPGILLLVSSYLGDHDYRVLTAPEGRTGLEVFARERPDFVLCDLNMPGLGGLGVLAEIKKQAPFTPFIVFSGTSDIELAVRALKEGAWDYLLKPLPGLDLLPPVLQRMEERARMLKEKEQEQARLEEQVRLRTAQLMRQLKEKDLLLAEVHHRVKNNLQIILVLLGLQKDHAVRPEVREALEASRDRVHTLAMVQDEMHDADHAILVDAAGYVTGMVHHLLSARGLAGKLELSLDVEALSLKPSLAFTCGLVLNELMTGLAGHKASASQGTLVVRFRAVAPGLVELELRDERAPWAEWMPTGGSRTLGWDLITALTAGGGGVLWDVRDPERIAVRMT